MDWNSAGQASMAVLSVVGAWSQLRRDRGVDRNRLKQDLEIINLLPEHSPARAPLLASIDQTLHDLVEDEAGTARRPSRAEFGIRLGLLALAVLFFTSAIRSRGTALWFLAAAVICGLAAADSLLDRRTTRNRERSYRSPTL